MFTKFLEQAKKIVATHQAEYAGHYIMFGGGSSSSTTKTDPWAGQQPYLTQAFQSAGKLYNNGDLSKAPQYYNDSTVANFNPIQSGAIGSIANTGLNGTGALNAANTSVQNILSGSPAMNQSIAASVVPGLESQFTQGNAMNNPAAAYAVSNGLSNALLQNQLGAAGTAQNLYNTQIGGQQAALQAGQTQQDQDQQKLTDQVNRWNYNQQLPYQQLNQFTNTVNGQYGSVGTTTSPNQSLLGSLFSDRRVKQDIRRIGSADNGLPIYLYRYKGQEAFQIGFMADEVEKVSPHAVQELNGLKMVDYKKAMGE